jgi:hypothetical protein
VPAVTPTRRQVRSVIDGRGWLGEIEVSASGALNCVGLPGFFTGTVSADFVAEGGLALARFHGRHVGRRLDGTDSVLIQALGSLRMSPTAAQVQQGPDAGTVLVEIVVTSDHMFRALLYRPGLAHAAGGEVPRLAPSRCA